MLRFPQPEPSLDPHTLRQALDQANLPALLMVVYQLSGDERWLQERYRPQRRFGMDPNDSGGFGEDVQREIREAAHQAVMAWARGAAPAVSKPSAERLVGMMSRVMSERIPAEYEAMFAEQMGFADALGDAQPYRDKPDFFVVVIGAGLGGLMTAIKLQQAGISYVVLERNQHVGGVWWENGYPGAGVDTPSYLYTFSFFPRNWDHYFVKRDALVDYLDDVAQHFNLLPSIRFGVEVKGMVFDEARQQWTIQTLQADGSALDIKADAVVSAVGTFSQPKTPRLAGAEQFKGPIFHSARWPKGLDVAGKKVALVGTGASAMQILPAIVDKATQVSVFQRSPAWVIPVSNYFDAVPGHVHWLINQVPYYFAWYRFSLAWTFNDKLHPTLQVDPQWPHQERSISAVNERHRKAFSVYIEEQLAGRADLLVKCLPKYPPWGKRMLIDNGWYAALKRPHVELIDEAVVSISASGVVSASGLERQADVIVYSTGFETTRYLLPMHVVGRGGQVLREVWEDDNCKAYMGITAPGFPNLFIVYGPNSNGNGGSALAWSESQVGYIVQLLRAMIDKRIGALEPRQDLHDEYNAKVDAAHARMIWTHPGFSTYYRNSRGRVVVQVPWRVVDYWRMLRQARLDDYVIEALHSSRERTTS